MAKKATISKYTVKKEKSKEKYAGPKGSMGMEVKTPYPKETKKSDVDFIGEELVKLSNRLNEIELSINDMSIQLKQVRSRMGLV